MIWAEGVFLYSVEQNKKYYKRYKYQPNLITRNLKFKVYDGTCM